MLQKFKRLRKNVFGQCTQMLAVLTDGHIHRQIQPKGTKMKQNGNKKQNKIVCKITTNQK
jgi:hypothetical protein